MAAGISGAGRMTDNKSLLLGDYLFVDIMLCYFNALAALEIIYEIYIKRGDMSLQVGLFHLYGIIWSLSFIYVLYHISSILLIKHYEKHHLSILGKKL